MGYFWVAGHKFKIDANVVRWDERGKGQYGPFNAYWKHCSSYAKSQCGGGGVYPFGKNAWGKNRPNRYSFRPGLPRTMNPPLDMVQDLVRMFVIHFDNCLNSEMCYKVLHDERGLSVHFLIDNDGTIYQTLDLCHMGFQCAHVNAFSFGVELANMGDAKRYEGWYTSPRYARFNRGPKRAIDAVKVHGHTMLCYHYTDAQMRALTELAKGLRFALPNLALEYPQSAPGKQSWGLLPNFRSFKGYLGHYHTTEGKWDPGLFDFKKFIDGIRGSICFPVFTRTDQKIDYPLVPDDADTADKEFRKLFDQQEQHGAGYFPVGPYGEWKLWHGGVHMPGKRGTPIYASFTGQIVAACMGKSSQIGSNNFVLLRHDVSLGPVSMRFFALYYHLDDEFDDAGDSKKHEPKWLADPQWQSYKAAVKAGKARKGDIVLLGIPISAGEQLGRIGVAGPPAYREAQFHFEIFAQDERLNKVEPNAWKKVFGTGGGRFSDAAELNAAIDVSPKDGKFSRRELMKYFSSNAGRKALHRYAVLHMSEWIGPLEGWKIELRHAPDFADMSDTDFDDLVNNQIAPTLWWDAKAKHYDPDPKKQGQVQKKTTVAAWANLPFSGIVYHYHPIAFVKFVTDKMAEAAAVPDAKLDKSKATRADTVGLKGDIDDHSGASFVDARELVSKDDRNQYRLETIVKGFPGD